MKKLILSLLVVPFISSAELSSEAQNFCNLDELNKLSKAKRPVKELATTISELGNVHYADNASDCALLKNSLKDPKTIVLDARDRGSRGVINGALKLVSDHDDMSSHEYTPEKFSKKVSKYLEKKRGVKNANLKDYKLVIFCNGPTCYRTSWAACSLNKQGHKKENIHLYLDGFMGIKKSCLH